MGIKFPKVGGLLTHIVFPWWCVLYEGANENMMWCINNGGPSSVVRKWIDICPRPEQLIWAGWINFNDLGPAPHPQYVGHSCTCIRDLSRVKHHLHCLQEALSKNIKGPTRLHLPCMPAKTCTLAAERTCWKGVMASKRSRRTRKPMLPAAWASSECKIRREAIDPTSEKMSIQWKQKHKMKAEKTAEKIYGQKFTVYETHLASYTGDVNVLEQWVPTVDERKQKSDSLARKRAFIHTKGGRYHGCQDRGGARGKG